LAGRAVHRARGGHVRLPRADTLGRRRARHLAGRLPALGARLGGRGPDLPARRVLAADERAAAPRGRAAGRAARDRSARADLPGAADLPAPDEGRDHAAGLQRAAAAAHLALPDGQLDHPRRRGHLVAAVRAPAGGAGAGAGLAGGVERGRGAGAVRVARLPAVPELGDRALLAVGDEDRVVAEALGAAWLGDDAPLQRARAAQLAAVCVQGHELADVAGATGVALHARERLEQPLDRVAGGEAGGVHARAAPETRDLDARVLPDRPAVGGREPAPEDGLAARVVGVGVAVLGRELARAEQRQPPVRHRRCELLELVRVPRRQNTPHRCHSTRLTWSILWTSSSTPAAAETAGRPASMSTTRASPASSISNFRTRTSWRSSAASTSAALPPAPSSTSRRLSSGRSTSTVRRATTRNG